MNARSVSLVLLAAALPIAADACGDSGPSGPSLAPGVEGAVESITISDLRRRVGILADDSMRGRATPSPELEEVAAYIASEFAGDGVQAPPGASYLQRYDLPSEKQAGLPAALSTAVPEPTPGGGSGGGQGMNVIGWLEGSDLLLRNQYIVVSAHMDHLGVGTPVSGDSIYNGADDNASGTAAVLELAEAFARLQPRPRRSIVFVAFSGEERGLLGSKYYVEHPRFPLGSTVAEVNIDMIGRNWPDTVVAARSPDSDIGRMAEAAGKAHAELGLAVIDDPWPGSDLLLRSDQFPFLQAGVPALFYHSGVHEDYHRPSDEPDKIDYEKTARIVRLIFHTVRELAEVDRPPTRLSTVGSAVPDGSPVPN